jgi:hypothetical protein
MQIMAIHGLGKLGDTFRAPYSLFSIRNMLYYHSRHVAPHSSANVSNLNTFDYSNDTKYYFNYTSKPQTKSRDTMEGISTRQGHNKFRRQTKTQSLKPVEIKMTDEEDCKNENNNGNNAIHAH